MTIVKWAERTERCYRAPTLIKQFFICTCCSTLYLPMVLFSAFTKNYATMAVSEDKVEVFVAQFSRSSTLDLRGKQFPM